MILKLSLDLPEEKEYIRLSRTLGKCTLEYLNVMQSDIDDVETIVSELTSNVIRHAHSTEGRFGLILEYYAKKVVITVRDKGNGFSLIEAGLKPQERTGFNGELRLGGFGLKMVTGLSDSLRFTQSTRRGTVVKAEKILTYSSPLDAKHAAHMNSGEADCISIAALVNA
ncbi:hypothetical protein CCAX7_37240 [Capsulimonas corticalis]|uniref:Histidine kinase/HSP90-like ATPase domain-containing protein n=1 Tax=Capsulimonas corticalis TaxID=2219043 RepID=A0A402D146_9BACT|nr:ATP-binding protein [Capsulimonas corticalis]BDI31673.1 hypothetical protein CCAX7_37240 [Capsulimonas corticalis]